MNHRLSHEKLDVYQNSVTFVSQAHQLADITTIKIAAIDQLLRAAESVPVNIATASTRPGKTFELQALDIAAGSLAECAAALDVLTAWDLLATSESSPHKVALLVNYRMLLALRKSRQSRVQEDSPHYSADEFPHERLDCYREAITLVDWVVRNVSKDILPARSFDAADRSSTSVALNIAEGNARRSTKDKVRFFDIATTSALRLAAHLDIINARGESLIQDVTEGKAIICRIIAQLLGLKRHWNRTHED